MKDANNNNSEFKQYIKLYKWMIKQGLREGLKLHDILVYCWIDSKNRMAYSQQRGAIYGKVGGYKYLHQEITADLGIQDVDQNCKRLLDAKWIRKGSASEYDGKPQKGYYCLLDRRQKAEAKAEQQQQLMPDTPAADNAEGQPTEGTIVVTSDPNANGEFKRFGLRYYKDPDGRTHKDYTGNAQVVPPAAPPRPSLTAIWNEEYSQWFEPGQEPERPDDF